MTRAEEIAKDIYAFLFKFEGEFESREEFVESIAYVILGARSYNRQYYFDDEYEAAKDICWYVKYHASTVTWWGCKEKTIEDFTRILLDNLDLEEEEEDE